MAEMGDYADMGDNVHCVLCDAEHCVWRATGVDGQGLMTAYDLMPGVTVMFNDFTNVGTVWSGFHLMPETRMLCLNYCREGRIEWELESDRCLYLGAGDLGMDDHRRHALPFHFPFGHYRGVTICLIPEVADGSLKAAFPEGFPVRVGSIYEMVHASADPSALRSDEEVARIFSNIYSAPERYRAAYLKLKVMELLLHLGEVAREQELCDRRYLRRSQVDKARAIERAITSDLASNKTLGDLSQEYDFPYASMQRCFKEVYGMSIHAYLKHYRMARAATLLRTTSKPVGEIALEVGYANASKFATAFREAIGCSPASYRNSAPQER